MVVLIVLLAVSAVSLGAWSASTALEARTGTRRSLRAIDDYQLVDVRDEEMAQPIAARVFAPAGKAATELARRLTPVGYIDGVRRKIVLAGNPPGYEVDRFLTLKLLGVASVLVWIVLAAMFMSSNALMGILVVILASGICIFGPDIMLDGKIKRRRDEIERRLPDTLTLLSSSLRAGFSLMQGLEAVAQEIADPMRKELQRVFTEVRLGRPVEDALGDSALRMESRDLEWTVMAIRIQREVGGNLAVLLDTVADTMVKRERVRRELRALTAEGRLSAIVLSAVSPLLLLVIWLLQPSYLHPLWHEAIGIVAVAGALALEVVGWFWLRKIVDIEV